MIKEEFEEALNMLAKYCKGKGYVSAGIRYEIDFAAKDIAK